MGNPTGKAGEAIKFAGKSGTVRARNPVTPSGRGFRAKFFSHKNRRLIRCESLLEFDCLHLFEFARNVTGFEEQPLTIQYQLNHGCRRYTPDFSVNWLDGQRWIVEVKPAEKLAEECVEEKFARLSEVFAAQGERLVVLTDTHIRKATRLAQVKRLLQIRYGSWLDTEPLHDPAPLENRTIAEVLHRGIPKRVVINQLATRGIACCLDQVIVNDTMLTPFSGAHDDALFI